MCFISQLNRVYPNISAGTNDHGAVNWGATGLILVCTARKHFGVGIGSKNCERCRAVNGKDTGACNSCERFRAVNGKETWVCNSCERCCALNGK